jgi:hypothetical protein
MRQRAAHTLPCLHQQVLKVDGWQALMGDAHMVDSAFTLSDAMLAFLWSRMHVADEVKDYSRCARALPPASAPGLSPSPPV